MSETQTNKRTAFEPDPALRGSSVQALKLLLERDQEEIPRWRQILREVFGR